jgi:ribonuclease T2
MIRVVFLLVGILGAWSVQAADSYVLAVTLSPAFCDNTPKWRNSVQCRERKALNVHGLWPQAQKRSEAEYCAGGALQLSLAQEKALNSIMPDKSQREYQWKKHGRCSGLSSATYFDFLAKEFLEIRWPADLQTRGRDKVIERKSVMQALMKANPSISAEGIVLRCEGKERPPLLQEIRICLTPEGTPRRCEGGRGNCPVVVKIRAQ